ncbi:MAG TPA: cobalamin-binding protein [Phycisphaerales bacterium]|nr:cobalamin-binding protein [Phycisphaerales bacterium]
MRVVSLVPSATEIVARIGGLDLLVGRSHECDRPGDVRRLPALTRPRTSYNAGAGGGAIEHDAAREMEAAGSLYTLDADLLRRLRPDVVLTQDLCALCSIDSGSLGSVLEEMGSVDVVSLHPETFEAVLDNHLTVGRAIGLEAEAGEAVFELRGRWLGAESYVNPYTEGPVVGFLEWADPLYIAGYWVAQMIERAGGRHPLNECVARPGAGAGAGLQGGQRVAGRSVRVPGEVFAASRPEFLVICPCGLSLEQAKIEAARLRERVWWGDLPAVKAGRVAVVDGRWFSRPGPSLVDCFAWLVGWLNDRPELMAGDVPWALLGDG